MKEAPPINLPSHRLSHKPQRRMANGGSGCKNELWCSKMTEEVPPIVDPAAAEEEGGSAPDALLDDMEAGA